MFSFLPLQYKKLVSREYVIRFAAVVFAALAILGVVAAAFLTPYISFVKSQEMTSSSRLLSLSNSSQTKEAQSFRSALNTLKAEAVRLAAPNAVAPYELITELDGLVTSGIMLDAVTYGLNSDGSAALTVAGTALTRQALQTFVASLQAAPGFKGVSVPVSAFAQDKDINFNFGMTVLYENTH